MRNLVQLVSAATVLSVSVSAAPSLVMQRQFALAAAFLNNACPPDAVGTPAGTMVTRPISYVTSDGWAVSSLTSNSTAMWLSSLKNAGGSLKK